MRALAFATCLSWAATPAAGEDRPPRSAEERAAYLAEVRRLYEGSPDTWPAPHLNEGVEHRELGPLPRSPQETDGRDAERVRLGRQLFFDPRLSGSGQIACASCHDPDLGWADGRTTSFGHNRRRLTRNSPSILNSGYRKTLFWDGRAGSLEEQAVAVLNNADEMHSGDRIVVEHLRLVPEYIDAFRSIYGVESPGVDEAADALAEFERTVVSGRTKFDAFVDGRSDALTDEQVSGLHLFRTEARCLNCHNGPLLSDDKFHHIGLSFYGRPFEDLGRYNVTNNAEDVGAFRTPSLRDALNTRPYMHNGLFDLDEVLRLYNTGMPTARPRKGEEDDPLFPAKSPLIKPLGLNEQDLADIAAFLESLSESRRRVLPPDLPPGL